jgi:hypothetical protein
MNMSMNIEMNMNMNVNMNKNIHIKRQTNMYAVHEHGLGYQSKHKLQHFHEHVRFIYIRVYKK